jgi:hypothetical protein
MNNAQDQRPDYLRNLMLEYCTNEIASKIGENPYTRKFIFGSGKEYARLRNEMFELSERGRLTVLSAMLRYGLDNKRQSDLFPLPHHLGSRKSMPKEKLTLVRLAETVRKEKRISDDPHTRKKEFESITNSLKEITGRKFSDYANQQNTLRVIYLLDRMMVNPQYAREGRQQRFLTFIKSPTKFSFEARDAHPISDSEDNTQLLADLKAYIGIEIDNEIVERVDAFFYTVIDRQNEIRRHLDELAYLSSKPNDVVRMYLLLHAHVSSIKPAQPVVPKKTARLDHDLYLHLCRFEYLHFVGASKEILEAAKPPSPITTTWKQMVAALNAITNKENTYRDTTTTAIQLEAIPILLNDFSDLFLDLIQHALGFRPGDAAYQKSISLTQELIYRIKCFSTGKPLNREDVTADFRLFVSALCAVSQALKFRTTFRPRVFSNDGMSRSIITPLENPMSFENYVAHSNISEAYYQIWHHRLEWVQHALKGSTDVAELVFGLRHMLSEKIIGCIALNDITLIESSFDAFERNLLNLEHSDLDGRSI